jgi:opacity protein-like surface antigen
MFEREPNIDIVFRNGLKNMEVLPPADIWDNIPPMPVRHSRLMIISAIAAGVAALVSLALVATWYTRSSNPAEQLGEMTIASGDQQAIRIDRTTAITETTPVERPVAEFVRGTVPVEPAGEKMSTLTAEEPKAMIASADLTLKPEKDNSSFQIYPEDEITIITSGRLKGAEESLAATMNIPVSETMGQRFMVGASLTPAMGLSPSGQDMKLSELMNGERSRPSYTTGLTFGYKISDRLTINSGIGLASMGQTITGVDVFAGLSDFYSVKSNYLYTVETASGLILAGNTDLYLTDHQNRVGTLVQGNVTDPSKYDLKQVGDNIQQVFRYLELPLMLRYKVIDRKVGLNLSGGLAYGFLVDNSAYTGEGSEMIRVGSTEGINTHNLSSQLGLGMEYNISSNISFNLEPVFKYYVTPVSSISGPLYKPYSLGFWSGLFFRF